MDMVSAPTWLRRMSPPPLLLHKTTLTTEGSTSLPTCLLLTHVALCQRVRGMIARTRTDLLTYLR